MNSLQVYKTIIYEFLNVIHYQGDRKKFVESLVNYCYIQTIEEILSVFPEIERNSFIQKLHIAKTTEGQEELLASYIPGEIYSITMAIYFAKELKACVDDVRPSLTLNEKESLEQFLQKFKFT